MISDQNRLSISVTVDDSVVEPDVSVSLGLIVTELVINALKHAFPDQRTGKIVIDYSSTGKDWTLSVVDDGLGMVSGPIAPKPGLGTGIIEALTKNLQSEIELTDARPGTAVTIRHRQAGDFPAALSDAA